MDEISVRVAQQAQLLEVDHDVADRRRRDVQAVPTGHRLRADRLAGREVLGHDRVQNFLGTAVNIHPF